MADIKAKSEPTNGAGKKQNWERSREILYKFKRARQNEYIKRALI